MAAIGAIGAIVGLIGTGIQVIGGMQQAAAVKEQAKFEAKQLDQRAQEERAVAQRKALESRRRGDLVQSNLRAAAASSGGGVNDPTVVNLGGEIASRTEYDALNEMYKGENAARGYENQAEAAILSGKAQAQGLTFGAIGSGISGVASIFDRYSSYG